MDRVVAAPIIGRWPEAHAATTHRPSAGVPRAVDEPPVADGAPPPVDAAPPVVAHDGLLLVGAIGGLAAGSGLGALVGWPGTTVAVAAIIGLDVGLLLGAGVGSLLAGRDHRDPRV
jgi:hypothetical protein